MTTEEAIAAIRRILEEYVPGTWNDGLTMARFLEQAAKELDDSVNDDMSARHE